MPEPTTQQTFAYRAFISYSHRDKAWCDWLHKALETYHVPSRLVGKVTAHGTIPRRLNPIFRDREELASATDLGRKVNAALRESENLIVICSPASATSRWVNEEVLAYKRMGRADRIFCLIVDGEPNASDLPGHEAEECFCPALRFQLDASGQATGARTEPIAADARPGKDGKANAKLKLIAGMLDVGFDALKQREQQRRVRRMTAITALAVVVMAVTVVLAVFALISRHDAVIAQHKAVVAQQAAERRQKQAEGLVNFMLGDLNDKLAQVSRLDIMQSVDDKAMAYFQSLPTADVTDEALAQRAKALEKIGEVRSDSENSEGAIAAFRASAAISSRLAAKAPADAGRQIAYSRTLTYIGMSHWTEGKLDDAQRNYEAARRVLRTSLVRRSNNPPLLVQLSYIDNDIGHVLEARGKTAAAATAYQRMLETAKKAAAMKPDDADYLSDLGSAHNNIGKLALQRGDLATAIAEYRADDAIETRLSARDPRDNGQRQNMLRVRAILGRTLALAGDTAAGIRDLQQSVQLATQLTRFDPQVAEYQEFLALYSSQLARLQRLAGDASGAAASNTTAIRILAGLTRKDPGNQYWQPEYAESLTEQAAQQLGTGNTDAARASARKALGILGPALAKHPDDRGTLLATMEATLLLTRIGSDSATARALRAQALQTLQRVKTDPGDPRLLALQVEALLALGRKEEAQPLLKQLRNSGYRDPALLAVLQHQHIDYPANAEFSQQLATIMQADPAGSNQLRGAIHPSSATDHGNASSKEDSGH
ncbi:MAG TPA: TIR domain-containing protein [Rhodanobacteraceae bacterium]|nr:TIR domain-containing protein [Rhodanobacteraceae bacterium]